MTETTLPDALDDARAWSHDLQLRRWWIVEGLRVFLVVAGLSLAASTIEVVALVSQFQGAGSAAANAIGLGGSDVAQLLVTQWSLTYFGAHFVPVDLGLSGGFAGLALSSLPQGAAGVLGQSTSLSGLGSLTLTSIVVWLGFRTGRKLERQVPYAGRATMAALRAALVAVPYAAASLVLFFAGHWRLSVAGQVLLNAAPAPIAVVTPLLVLGLAAAAGAIWARPAHTRVEAAVLRGASLGLLALVAGIVATLALAVMAGVLWFFFTQASQAGGQAQTVPTPASPNQGQGTGELSWSGFLLVLLLLLLVGLYLLNAVAGLWAANVGFWLLNLGPLAVVVLAGPAVGAVSGAIFLRPLTDFIEHAAFVTAFAGGSFVLAVASQLTLFSASVGASPGLVLLVSGMLAAAAAAIGGGVSRTATGRALAAWAPLAACAARVDSRVARIVEPVRRPPAARAEAEVRCASCGNRLSGEDSFCARCGAAVPVATRYPGCGREADAGDVFCAGCGARVQPLSACTSRGRELQPEAAFCPGCGTRAQRAERR